MTISAAIALRTVTPSAQRPEAPAGQYGDPPIDDGERPERSRQVQRRVDVVILREALEDFGQHQMADRDRLRPEGSSISMALRIVCPS